MYVRGLLLVIYISLYLQEVQKKNNSKKYIQTKYEMHQ